MRIGFDAKRAFHNTTGLGNYSRDIIRSLSLHYKENEYILYNPERGNVRDFVLNQNMKEVLPTDILGLIFPSFWREVSIVKQLLKNNIQIYHGLTNELPIGIEKTHIKTVVTIHDLIFLRHSNIYPIFDRYNFIRKFKRACRITNMIIAVSKQTKRDIIDFFDIHPDKIKVCYQGCNIAFKKIYDKPYRDMVRAKFSLPKEFVLNVGTIEERKNLLTLVKAMENIDFPLVVVGRKTRYFKRVYTYISKKKMQDKVIFLECTTIEELACIYKFAKVFVYPSVFEGFGIPIIEALYSGVPVVAATGSCLQEAGGEYSHYNAPYDVEAMSESISTILQDSNIRQKMIEKGKKYVGNFDDEYVAKSIMSVYENL